MDERLPYYLPQWNLEDPEFKKLISDIERIELSPILNINDINKGSIHNALYWHIRSQKRTVDECDLRQSTEPFLSLWASFLDFQKPYPMTDAEFSAYIIQSILSGVVSLPVVKLIFDPYVIKQASDIPMFSDWMFCDLGALNPSDPYYICQSIPYNPHDALYVFMTDLNQYTSIMKGKIKAGFPAGVGLYIVIY